MQLLDLNADIAEIILALIQPRDAFQLTKTCRRAYALATPRWLGEITIGSSTSSTAAFCAFMLADIPRRLSCLRFLVIKERTFTVAATGEPRDPNIPAMIDVLRYATRLRAVKIEDLEEFLCTDLGFAHVLASHTGFRRLDFTNLRRRSWQMIAQMQSSPQVVTIGLHYLEDLAEDIPARAIHTFAPSLQKLVLRQSSRNRSSPFIRNLPAGVVWPLVHSLQFDGSCRSLSGLARAFPNVRHLQSLRTEVYIAASHTLGVLDSPATLDDGSQWEALDHVQISSSLPLSGRVRRLELDYTIYAAPFTYGNTLSLLQRTSPVVLRCSMDTQLLVHLPRITPALRYLQISSGSLKEVNLHSCMVDVAEALHTLPLIGLSVLVFRTTVLPSRFSPADGHYVSEVLTTMQATAASIPTLEYLTCQDQCHSEAQMSFRVVSRINDVPQLAEVSIQELIEVENRLLALDRA